MLLFDIPFTRRSHALTNADPMPEVTSQTTLVELTEMCARTAIFPPEVAKPYTLTGLIGELGEVCNKLKKIVRDDGSRLNPTRANEIHAELGDVVWYVVLMFKAWGDSPEGTIGNLMPIVPATGVFAAEKFTAPAVEFVIYCAYFPMTRSPKFILERLAGLIESIGALPRSQPTVEYPTFTLVEVADRVIQKLSSRAERGKIAGDGDTR